MHKNVIETVMGAVVLAVAGGFLAFAYQSSSMSTVDGYTLHAKFKSVSGISTGSDVRIGGIKVGVVSDMKLDPQTYQAVLDLHINNTTKLPDDSSASILGDGLLGGKFLALEPGGSETMFADGGTISFTQPAVNLESLIGKFMFSGGGVDKGDAKKEDGNKDKISTPSIE